jgi:C1A family cysteine protease
LKHLKGKLWLVGFLALLIVVSVTMLVSLSAQERRQQGEDLAVLKEKRIEAQIAEMQAEIRANGLSFRVGNNPAMKYEIEELTGFSPILERPLKYTMGTPRREPAEVLAQATSLPASYTSTHVTPVKNQLNCGSCWAFGSIAAFETAIHRAGGGVVDLSEQYIVSCNDDGWGCSGGWWPYDMFVNPGVEMESCFPYVAKDVACRLDCPMPYRAMGSVFLAGTNKVASVDAIKNAIYDFGGVCVGVYVDRWFQAYTGGVLNKCAKNARSVNHMVELVGWDDAKGAWKLKNSWGTGWGEVGYMWIKYGCNLVGYGASYVIY